MSKTFLHNLRSFLRFPIGSLWLPTPAQIFFTRLTGDALTFYRYLTTAQKEDHDELKRLFWQQYKPNANVLKAQVKYLRQLPGQDVSAFYRTLRDLAGKAYTDDAVCNEILLTTFIEGLTIFVVRWEVRKAKPTMVEDALSLALEMQSYLNLHLNSRTLPRRLLTIWLVLRRPKVNSFRISFSPSGKKLNES